MSSIQSSFQVRTLALDDYCASQKIWPSVVKVDIEGAEWFALGDAEAETLSKVRALALEVHEPEIRSLGGDAEALLRAIEARGLRRTPLEERWAGNVNIAFLRDLAASSRGA
jgi:hypothetical protein